MILLHADGIFITIIASLVYRKLDYDGLWAFLISMVDVTRVLFYAILFSASDGYQLLNEGRLNL